MENKDNHTEISNEVEDCCNNKEKLKVDVQIKLQKKCTKQVNQPDSPCSNTNYEHNEEALNLPRKSTNDRTQIGISKVRSDGNKESALPRS
jgi:predicted P-loop ATPase